MASYHDQCFEQRIHEVSLVSVLPPTAMMMLRNFFGRNALVFK